MMSNKYQKFPKTFANYNVIKEKYEEPTYTDKYNRFNNIRFRETADTAPGDAASVLKALQNCPPPAEPTDEINNQAVKNAANAMGIRSCSTSTTNVSMAFCSVGIMGCASAQGTHTENLGCETVQIIANKLRQTTQNINCVINNNVRTLDVSLRSNNAVKVSATNHSNITVKCPGGFNVAQTSTIKYIDLQTITSDQVATIADEIKNTSKDIVNAIQQNEQGYAGSPIGSKFVMDAQKQIDSLDFKEQVKNTIDQIKVRMNSNNEIEFIADNWSNLTIDGNSCTITQNSLIDYMSTKILNETISAVFKTKVESETSSNTTASSKNKTEGAPDVVGGMFSALSSMAMGGFILIGIIVIGLVMILPSILKSVSGEDGKLDPEKIKAAKSAVSKK